MSALAVIFDFDGVIADTEPLHLAATQRALAGRGAMLSPAEYAERYLGYTDHGLFEALGNDRSLGWTSADVAALVADKSVMFNALLAGTSVVYPSAENCIVRLAALGFPLAIASGAFGHEIVAILEAANLRRHFRAIVGAGDYANGKPAPDPFLEAARRIGLPASEAVAIEDSHWGIESARAAGCATVAVTHTYTRSVLAADIVVDSLDEIDGKLLMAAKAARR
jgi:HAD superfamily hydrolase (TIGR01509 family)